jgi:hypothetical protein
MLEKHELIQVIMYCVVVGLVLIFVIPWLTGV